MILVDAVYAMAHAAHNILKDECGNPGILCEGMKPTPPGAKLLKYIRNVSFTGKKYIAFVVVVC